MAYTLLTIHTSCSFLLKEDDFYYRIGIKSGTFRQTTKSAWKGLELPKNVLFFSLSAKSPLKLNMKYY